MKYANLLQPIALGGLIAALIIGIVNATPSLPPVMPASRVGIAHEQILV